MISRRTLGWIILAYTLLSWGGRIGLLTDADAADAWSWVRIGGSFAVGILTWACLVSGRLVRPAAFGFAGFTAVVWTRSLVTVWTDPANTLGFNLVHTALAALWVVLAVLAVRVGQATGSGVRSPATGVAGGTISESADTTSSIDR